MINLWLQKIQDYVYERFNNENKILLQTISEVRFFVSEICKKCEREKICKLYRFHFDTCDSMKEELRKMKNKEEEIIEFTSKEKN